MPIFKIKDDSGLLSIAAIFPPESKYRNLPDNKSDDGKTFHIAIVNDKGEDYERSAFIELSKSQLKSLSVFIEDYLKTGITKEI